MRAKLGDVTENLDYKRVPIAQKDRADLEKLYPYYGAQGIVDYVDDYIFDGEYLLVAEDGENLRSRKNSIVTFAKGKFWVNNHAHILGEKAGTNLTYIYYLLKGLDLSGYITGSAQPKLTQENLSRLEIDIPDVQCQKDVATLLSTIDAKIDNNNAIAAELEGMAKDLYDYWCVQVDFPDENGKPYKSRGGKMVWNEELKREIPEGWEVDKLGKHITSSRGISYNSATLEGDGVPMINLASFGVDSNYKPAGIKTYNGQYDADKILHPFDLIMCNTQQTAIDPTKDIIGKAMLVPDIFDGDVVSSHHVTTITPDVDELKYYLYGTCKTTWFHKYIVGFASGTNILGLDFKGFEDYLMPLPPMRLLKKFATAIKNIESEKNLIITKNAELASLRDFLLPMLMNGQVKVKGA